MVEHVKVRDTILFIDPDRALEPGENIVPSGAEAKSGSVLVPDGTRLAASHIAAAAACGYATVPVYTRPRVAILATGDELVPSITLHLRIRFVTQIVTHWQRRSLSPERNPLSCPSPPMTKPRSNLPSAVHLAAICSCSPVASPWASTTSSNRLCSL